MPKDTLSQPCNIVIMARSQRVQSSQTHPFGGKTFFQKLLNSNMKEANKGIVQLKIRSLARDSAMGNTPGKVQILDEDDPTDVIAIADYLFLHDLKTHTENDQNVFTTEVEFFPLFIKLLHFRKISMRRTLLQGQKCYPYKFQLLIRMLAGGGFEYVEQRT